MFLLNLEN